MSNATTIASGITGAGLSLYGLYNYATAKGSSEEVSKQRQTALLCMGVGMAALAYGIGSEFLGVSAASMPETINIQPALAKIEEVGNCPISKLKDLISKGGENSITAAAFRVFNKTQGISCKNYLPWKAEFHKGGTGYIDGVFAKDMAKAAMWGIDPSNRPSIHLKSICDKTFEGATTLFQRYTGSGFPMVEGAHGEASQCCIGLGNLLSPTVSASKFLDKFTGLLNGTTLVGKFIERTCELALAK